MTSKPSIFDIKYENMNFEEASLNYDRDKMLWEQTEALKQLAQERHNAEMRQYFYSGDYSYSDSPKVEETEYYPFNNFNKKTDTIKYNEYQKLYADYNILLKRAEYISVGFMSWLCLILTVLILSEPICIVANLPLAKTIGKLILFQLGIIVLTFHKATVIRRNANKILLKLKQLDEEAEQIKKSRRQTKKSQKNKKISK